MKGETATNHDGMLVRDGIRQSDGTTSHLEHELNTLHDGLRGLASMLSALTGMDHIQGRGYILGTKQEHIIGMIDCHAGMAADIIELWNQMREVQAQGIQA
jgi:hypothetical protein